MILKSFIPFFITIFAVVQRGSSQLSPFIFRDVDASELTDDTVFNRPDIYESGLICPIFTGKS